MLFKAATEREKLRKAQAKKKELERKRAEARQWRADSIELLQAAVKNGTEHTLIQVPEGDIIIKTLYCETPPAYGPAARSAQPFVTAV
eukprot:COSAG01_NODE_48527_length_380_cov_1.309609_1_plen_88_part_00